MKYPLRNSMTSSTWTKLWTLTRTRVEFWRWRDAPIPLTSFTLSGSQHTASSLREGVLNLPRSYWTDLCPWFAFSPVPDYVKATVETVMKIHETEDDGDVLAFLTGQVGGYALNITQQLFTVCYLQKESRSVWSIFFLFIMLLCMFSPRKRWRKWFPFCRSRPGLCLDMAWRNTSESCRCTLVFLTQTRWRSLRGRPPLFAR